MGWLAILERIGMNEKKENVFGTILIGGSVVATATHDYWLAVWLFMGGWLWIVITKCRAWWQNRQEAST